METLFILGIVNYTITSMVVVTTRPITKADPLNGSKYALRHGDASQVISELPSDSIDCVITSPPYFQLRDYDINSNLRQYLIGEESDVNAYVDKLSKVFQDVWRVLKPQGALWLNLGDKYENKDLLGIPWMVVFALKKQGWILRDDIIWNQRKGTQSVKDRMRDAYEHLFFFVKNRRYHFDADKIRIKPSGNVVDKNGVTVSATGVTGRKYREQINSSRLLSSAEKQAALNALDSAVKEMREGKIVDFRMTIRGIQRTYHSESGKISGRAKELEKAGFFILKMSSSGFLPTNIWNIVPEDEWRKDAHCAVFPKPLLDIPLKSTCPPGGIVLDPFCGIGTTVVAAIENNCRGIGIDLSQNYLTVAKKRLDKCLVYLA